MFLGPNAQPFVGNGDHFPLDVFLPALKLATPHNVPLSFSRFGPIGLLALNGAVGAFLAAAA